LGAVNSSPEKDFSENADVESMQNYFKANRFGTGNCLALLRRQLRVGNIWLNFQRRIAFSICVLWLFVACNASEFSALNSFFLRFSSLALIEYYQQL